MNRNDGLRMLAAGVFALGLSGCGKDCRETLRMGDFELSQGNYPRAEKLYEEALEIDAAACADAEGKLENVRMLME